MHGGSSTRKWRADTWEEVRTGDGGVGTVGERRTEVGEDGHGRPDQVREAP